MNIYYYDKNTKEYLATGICDANPEESKLQEKFVPLVPAFATIEPLPVFDKKCEIPIFENNKWIIKKDYRKNYKQVDKDLQVFDIQEIGELSDGYYLVENDLATQILDNSTLFKIENNTVLLKSEEEFSAQKLDEAKNIKYQENEKKRNVEFIETPIGKLKTETPLGDLKMALPLYDKIVQANNGLNKDTIRLYKDGEIIGNPPLTIDEYNELAVKVAMEYIKIDTLSTKITQQILKATTIDEVQQITIDYSNLEVE